MASLLINGIVKLTRDAEVFTGRNSSWIHLGLAAFRSKAKEGMQDVDFFEAEYYYKNPEQKLENILKKGALLYLDRAELRNDRFEGKDGKQKSRIKVLVFSFEILKQNGEVKEIVPKPEEKPEPKLIDGSEPPF